MNVRFTVVIPAKNESRNIGRCLDSIFAIDYPRKEYEVIVVDNGSSDDTVRIAREKGAVVHVRPDLTISGLRNFGAAQAKGEILAFLDADCTVEPDWLLEASRYRDRPDATAFGSPPGVPPEATWVQKAWFEVRRKRQGTGPTDWLESMNLFVRRDAYLALGGFDESLVTCEDYDLSMRLKEQGSLIHDDRIRALHHGEAATLGHFFRKEMWRGTSNYRGVRRHGITRDEIPSLAAPLVHCLLLLLAITSAVPGFPLPPPVRPASFLLLLSWQGLLLLTGIRKALPSAGLPRGFQIHLLLNVYLLARGCSLLPPMRSSR